MAQFTFINGNGVEVFFTYTTGNMKVQNMTLVNNGPQSITAWAVYQEAVQSLTALSGETKIINFNPDLDCTTPVTMKPGIIGFEVTGVSAYGYHYN